MAAHFHTVYKYSTRENPEKLEDAFSFVSHYWIKHLMKTTSGKKPPFWLPVPGHVDCHVGEEHGGRTMKLVAMSIGMN